MWPEAKAKDEKIEEWQREASELEDSVEDHFHDIRDGLRNAVSCETRKDYHANIRAAEESVERLLKEVKALRREK